MITISFHELTFHFNEMHLQFHLQWNAISILSTKLMRYLNWDVKSNMNIKVCYSLILTVIWQQDLIMGKDYICIHLYICPTTMSSCCFCRVDKIQTSCFFASSFCWKTPLTLTNHLKSNRIVRRQKYGKYATKEITLIFIPKFRSSFNFLLQCH